MQKKALLYAYNNNLIKESDYKGNEEEYRQIIKSLRDYAWRSEVHGRGEVPADFMRTPSSHITVELKQKGKDIRDKTPNKHTDIVKEAYVNVVYDKGQKASITEPKSEKPKEPVGGSDNNNMPGASGAPRVIQ